ncbi:testis-specific protein 10-interacting protein [Sorex fumeus]|uniref:testis-specific protein 10-interacting protein n=1 Tax=Sorex fumeus TaxID=62283 RepID=UPI0024AD5A2C|nr:testis-specific protein 10-interacting protein [Sorex fumeus]
MTRGLLKLLSSILQYEQGGLGSRDVTRGGPQSRSRSLGQTARERKGRGHHKKGHSRAKADLCPAAPRKPSFPFQWAWESRALLQSGSSHPGLHIPPVALEMPQRPPKQKATMPKLPVAHATGWRLKVPSAERKPAAPSPAQSQGLELPRKKAWLGRESDDDGLRELPRLPRRGPAVEEAQAAEAPEEAESEGERPTSAGRLQGPQQRKVKARDVDRLWHLEKPHRQRQRDSTRGAEKQSRKALQALLNASKQTGKGQAWGDREASLYVSVPTRTFHKRQEATRNLLRTREQQQQQERQQEEQRRARELRVQQQVARCLAAYTPRASRGCVPAMQKLEELRCQERQRFTEYQAELHDIRQRVQARPYLFQQAMQANARLSVNRRFSRVLSALGLDEKQLLADADKRDVEDTARNPSSPKGKTVAGSANCGASDTRWLRGSGPGMHPNIRRPPALRV